MRSPLLRQTARDNIGKIPKREFFRFCTKRKERRVVIDDVSRSCRRSIRATERGNVLPERMPFVCHLSSHTFVCPSVRRPIASPRELYNFSPIVSFTETTLRQRGGISHRSRTNTIYIVKKESIRTTGISPELNEPSVRVFRTW